MVYIFAYRGDMDSTTLRKEALRYYHDITESPTYVHLYYDNGVPYIDNGRYISITHTDDGDSRIELIAIGDSPLGIDVESRGRCTKYDVAKRYFQADEIEYIDGDASRFVEIWTKKEAYGKSTGEGLYLGSVMDIGGFREYHIYEGYIVTLYSLDDSVVFVTI